MSTFASGTLYRVGYVAESTLGTTPSTPTLKLFRGTTRNINPKKNILRSAEIQADRITRSVRHGFNSVEGALGGELSIASFDDWIEAAMASTWSASPIQTTGVNLAIAAGSGGTITRASGSFITDGFRPGDIIVLAGFTAGANNAQWRIASLTATVITVVETGLVNESTAASRTVTLVGSRVDVGVSMKGFTVERQMVDIAQYQPARGVVPNGMNISVRPEAIPTIEFPCIGLSFPVVSGTSLSASPPAAVSTKSPLASFDGSVYEGGSANAAITGITINLANNRALEPVVGSKYSPAMFEGRLMLTGTITMLAANATFLNKFINETGTKLWFRLNDEGGTDFLNFVIPKMVLTGGDINPPESGAVTITVPWEAVYDTTTGSVFSVQRSNA